MAGRLLIVDDDDSIRELLTVLAGLYGFEVVGPAENGRQGVDFAVVEQPDAVILDQEMPLLDGVSALPLIRQAAPDAVIVMFSSSGPQLADTALGLGAAAYFEKGAVSFDEVMQYLREHTPEDS